MCAVWEGCCCRAAAHAATLDASYRLVACAILQSSNGNSATLDLTTASLTGVASGSDRRSGDLPTVSLPYVAI